MRSMLRKRGCVQRPSLLSSVFIVCSFRRQKNAAISKSEVPVHFSRFLCLQAFLISFSYHVIRSLQSSVHPCDPRPHAVADRELLSARLQRSRPVRLFLRHLLVPLALCRCVCVLCGCGVWVLVVFLRIAEVRLPATEIFQLQAGPNNAMCVCVRGCARMYLSGVRVHVLEP